MPPREIVPRPLRLTFARDRPRYWLARDPASTHLFNALSIAFPRGEKMFVESVRAYHDAISDPALRAAVRDFIAQEMNHSRAHAAFNAWLGEIGLPVAEMDAELAERLRGREHLPREVRLAATCALEHFTAMIAHALLASPDLLASMDEDMRLLWSWHAVEEIEHKSVAFDVYQHVGGRYSVRAWVMIATTLTFLTRVTLRQRRLLRADGQLGNARSRLGSAWRFFGPRGHFAGLAPMYLAYFRPGFHPWQHDDTALVREARARIEAAIAARAEREAA